MDYQLYKYMNNDITIHRVVYWIYYERVEGICEQVVKYFFILLLNIYNEFADFITAGKIFHNLGALFRIEIYVSTTSPLVSDNRVFVRKIGGRVAGAQQAWRVASPYVRSKPS